MTRALVLAALLGSVGTCSSRPGQPPPTEDGAIADAQASDAREQPATPTVTPAPTGNCHDARCWLELADVARQRGAFDVAAAHLGRAHAIEPTRDRLFAWIDALQAAGELRRARTALDDARTAARDRKDAALVAEIDARLASLPASPVAPATSSDDLRLAHEAMAAGRLDDAASAFSRALADHAEPAELARFAELQSARGQANEARRLWSRARAAIHERDGSLDVVAVEPGFTRQVLWRAGELAILRRFGPALDIMASPVGALDLQPARPGAPAVRRLRFPRAVEVMAFSADGRTLVRDDDAALVFQDMSSGAITHRLALDGRPSRIAVVGSGEAMFVLVAHNRVATLWTGRGEQLQRFTLTGTTPTITRAYTGEGTYHHNILEDSPTWPVSLALTDDAGLVAIGGSDSKIRLFDRKRGREHELAFKWPYTERRHMGGNPDLNLPLDLRFVVGGAELVAVHTHGELVRWDTARGAVLRQIAGTCSAAEARPVVNRYNEPGQPQRAATNEERRSCGHAVTGAFSPTGARVVTGGGLQGIRVRDVPTGVPRAMFVGERVPDQYLALADDGTVVGASLFGALTLLSPDRREPTELVPPHPSGPTDPTISATGRFLQFQVERRRLVWDLVARRRLDLAGPKEELLALAPAGDLAAIHTGDAVELRDVATGSARFRLPTRASAFSSRVQFSSTSGQVLIVTDDDKGRSHVVVELPAGKAAPVRAPIGQDQVWLSPDGRWLASAPHNQPAQIWRRDTGELVATLEDHVRHLAFAPDGAFVVSLRQVDPAQQGARARLRWLDKPGRSDIPEIALDGWAEFVAVNAAGDEIVILNQGGQATRWRPQTGARTDVKDVGLIMARRVHYADDGKTLLFEGYGRVLIRANDPALTPLAIVAPLLSGGWLAASMPGAIDGSGDAPRHLITRVRGPGGPWIHDGELAWDAVHVPGVVARALAGEAVQPPLPLGSAHPPSAEP